MKTFLLTVAGVFVGAGLFGAALRYAGKDGKAGAPAQALAKYINEGFSVDF